MSMAMMMHAPIKTLIFFNGKDEYMAIPTATKVKKIYSHTQINRAN